MYYYAPKRNRIIPLELNVQCEATSSLRKQFSGEIPPLYNNIISYYNHIPWTS